MDPETKENGLRSQRNAKRIQEPIHWHPLSRFILKIQRVLAYLSWVGSLSSGINDS